MPGPFVHGASNTVTYSASSVTLPSEPVNVTWIRVEVAASGLGGAVIVGLPPPLQSTPPGQKVMVLGSVKVLVAAVGQTE